MSTDPTDTRYALRGRPTARGTEPLGALRTPKGRHAGPARCRAWFGMTLGSNLRIPSCLGPVTTAFSSPVCLLDRRDVPQPDRRILAPGGQQFAAAVKG